MRYWGMAAPSRVADPAVPRPLTLRRATRESDRFSKEKLHRGRTVSLAHDNLACHSLWGDASNHAHGRLTTSPTDRATRHCRRPAGRRRPDPTTPARTGGSRVAHRPAAASP